MICTLFWEEVGLCGAHTAAHGIARITGSRWTLHVRTMFPEAGIRFPRRWGKGAGIKVMDGSLMCHGAVVERLKELAAGHGDSGPAGSHVRWRDGCRSHAYFP